MSTLSYSSMLPTYRQNFAKVSHIKRLSMPGTGEGFCVLTEDLDVVIIRNCCWQGKAVIWQLVL